LYTNKQDPHSFNTHSAVSCHSCIVSQLSYTKPTRKKTIHVSHQDQWCSLSAVSI